MRLLLLNPNTTEALTHRLQNAAVRVLPKDVEVIPVTSVKGFPYISSRAEAQIAGAEVLSIFAERLEDFDAAVIAAFGDPGLSAARELFNKPITGMSEASMVTALSLGEKFAFVTFSPSLSAWYEDQVRRSSLESRFAGTFTPETKFASITAVAEDLRLPLIETCKRAANAADVIILAGAPIAGLADDIADEVPAILIDPIQAAAIQAYTLQRLRPSGASVGSFARPPKKDSVGLPSPLYNWIAHRQD